MVSVRLLNIFEILFSNKNNNKNSYQNINIPVFFIRFIYEFFFCSWFIDSKICEYLKSPKKYFDFRRKKIAITKFVQINLFADFTAISFKSTVISIKCHQSKSYYWPNHLIKSIHFTFIVNYPIIFEINQWNAAAKTQQEPKKKNAFSSTVAIPYSFDLIENISLWNKIKNSIEVVFLINLIQLIKKNQSVCFFVLLSYSQ